MAKHRKVHLFDIDIPGRQTFKVGSICASALSGQPVYPLHYAPERSQERPNARVSANMQESDTLSPGGHLTTFTAPFGTIGLGICYDIVRSSYINPA